MSDTEYDESGTYPQYRSRRGPSKDQWAIWGTWAIRALIPVICWLAWQQNQSMQELQLTIARMSVTQDYQTQQLAKHSTDIDRIWQQIRQQPK